MELKLLFLFLFATFFGGHGIAQNSFPLTDGLLRANFTISPGYLLKQKSFTIYLHGEIEYFPEDKLSLKGDFFYYIDSQQNGMGFETNHSILAGGVYYFGKSGLIPYFGLQPGVNISKYKDNGSANMFVSKRQISPVFSATSGFVFIFHNYFNFYFSLNYINGKFFADLPQPEKLNEIRLSAGLGFNIFLKRQ